MTSHTSGPPTSLALRPAGPSLNVMSGCSRIRSASSTSLLVALDRVRSRCAATNAESRSNTRGSNRTDDGLGLATMYDNVGECKRGGASDLPTPGPASARLHKVLAMKHWSARGRSAGATVIGVPGGGAGQRTLFGRIATVHGSSYGGRRAGASAPGSGLAGSGVCATARRPGDGARCADVAVTVLPPVPRGLWRYTVRLLCRPGAWNGRWRCCAVAHVRVTDACIAGGFTSLGSFQLDVHTPRRRAAVRLQGP